MFSSAMEPIHIYRHNYYVQFSYIHCRYGLQLVDKSCQRFRQLNSALNHQMKEAAAKGIGTTPKQAEVITVEQENDLWERGFLGSDEPEKLRDTVLWLFGLNFALRAGQEHRSLRMQNSQASRFCRSMQINPSIYYIGTPSGVCKHEWKPAFMNN